MLLRKLSADLEQWSLTSPRKPLLIKGASHLGKTMAVTHFSKKFPQFIHIDLKEPVTRKLFHAGQSPDQILEGLFFLSDRSPSVKRTLIFLDEIQESMAAMNWLRNMRKRYSELFIIASSSLITSDLHILEQDLDQEVVVIPVDPLRFEEFLEAFSDKPLLDAFREPPVPAFMHNKLMRSFHQYALIGGIPEIVDQYLAERNLHSLKPAYETLLISYLEEIDRYGISDKQRVLLRFLLQNAFPYAGMRIKFKGFGNSSYRSREMGSAFRILETSGLLRLVYPVTETNPPLAPEKGKSPRLHLLDTGMVTYFSGIGKQLYQSDDLNLLFKGQIIRQVVGQEIKATLMKQETLHFWVRKKPQSTAEVDFVIPYEDMIIPVEVKSGEAGRLRSLHQFQDEAPHPYAVRLYAGQSSIRQTRTLRGKKFFLLSLPYYLASRIRENLAEFIKFANAVTAK